jgi:DNA-binding NtrC family response regulator
MVEMVSALLVNDREETFSPLKPILESQCIVTREARTCGEALLSLWGKRPPHLVFTDVQLADGNWRDVISLADKCPLPINIVVISRQLDMNLYIEAMERGAFDFITPPFEAPDVAHVVRCAAQNVLRRRLAHQSLRKHTPGALARAEWQQAVVSAISVYTPPGDCDL